jgi:hypothetical protein
LLPPSSDFGIDEWKSARQVFEKFDDRQHDLRKYGFTFLSALIAADSLTKLVNADDRISLAVVGITLLLTVALSLLDRNYELYKKATAIRAKILEVRLNLELTETISYRYEMDRFSLYVLVVYAAFAIVAGLVGISVLYPKVLLLLLTAAFTVAAVIVLGLIHKLKPNLERSVDWSFDRVMCEQGEKVRIIATNLCGSDPVCFDIDKPAWEVWKDGETTKPVHTEPSAGIVIGPGNNYSWELPTLEPGIYRVFPYHVLESKRKGDKWIFPLERAIIISEPKPKVKPAPKDY